MCHLVSSHVGGVTMSSLSLGKIRRRNVHRTRFLNQHALDSLPRALYAP